MPRTVTLLAELRAATIINRLAADRSATGLRDFAVVAAMRYGGLRVSEVCALELNDVVGRFEALSIRNGKTRNARRLVPLVARVAR